MAVEMYNLKTVVVAFSGGKDSLVAGNVVLPIAEKLGLKFKALHCYTGINVKENFEYVLDTCNRLGWHLDVETVDPRFSYEEIVRRYGFPTQGIHTGVMMWLKWFSIRRYFRARLDEKIGFITGRRKKESKRRMRLKSAIQLNVEGERKDAPIPMISPLFWWTTPQVWDFINTNNLEICPVYKTLHISGDCLCGCFAESGEAELLSVFHKETAMYIAELERKYGGKWGLGSSITGALQQDKLDGFLEDVEMHYDPTEMITAVSSSSSPAGIEDSVCAECFVDRVKKTTAQKKSKRG